MRSNLMGTAHFAYSKEVNCTIKMFVFPRLSRYVKFLFFAINITITVSKNSTNGQIQNKTGNETATIAQTKRFIKRRITPVAMVMN